MPFSSQRPVCEHTNDDLEYLETKQSLPVCRLTAHSVFFFSLSQFTQLLKWVPTWKPGPGYFAEGALRAIEMKMIRVQSHWFKIKPFWPIWLRAYSSIDFPPPQPPSDVSHPAGWSPFKTIFPLPPRDDRQVLLKSAAVRARVPLFLIKRRNDWGITPQGDQTLP